MVIGGSNYSNWPIFVLKSSFAEEEEFTFLFRGDSVSNKSTFIQLFFNWCLTITWLESNVRSLTFKGFLSRDQCLQPVFKRHTLGVHVSLTPSETQLATCQWQSRFICGFCFREQIFCSASILATLNVFQPFFGTTISASAPTTSFSNSKSTNIYWELDFIKTNTTEHLLYSRHCLKSSMHILAFNAHYIPMM